MRTGEGQQDEYRVSHMIFVDNCYLFATSKEEIREMTMDTSEELRRRGLDKEDQMELVACGLEGKIGYIFWNLTKRSTE